MNADEILKEIRGMDNDSFCAIHSAMKKDALWRQQEVIAEANRTLVETFRKLESVGITVTVGGKEIHPETEEWKYDIQDISFFRDE